VELLACRASGSLPEGMTPPRVRVRYVIHGLVQGVGFRPYIFRVAHKLGVAGFIRNTPEGVQVEVEGSGERIAHFWPEMLAHLPPAAEVTTASHEFITPQGDETFAIVESGQEGEKPFSSHRILPSVMIASVSSWIPRIAVTTTRLSIAPIAVPVSPLSGMFPMIVKTRPWPALSSVPHAERSTKIPPIAVFMRNLMPVGTVARTCG